MKELCIIMRVPAFLWCHKASPESNILNHLNVGFEVYHRDDIYRERMSYGWILTCSLSLSIYTIMSTLALFSYLKKEVENSSMTLILFYQINVQSLVTSCSVRRQWSFRDTIRWPSPQYLVRLLSATAPGQITAWKPSFLKDIYLGPFSGTLRKCPCRTWK